MVETRRHIRTQTGVVTSDKMDKTVVVAVERRFKHPVYKKYVVRHSRFKAHDPQNACKKGDVVVIKESRPISKDKRWRVQKVVDRGTGR